MKRRKFYYIGTFLLTMLLFCGAIFFLGLFRTHPASSDEKIPQEVALLFPVGSHFRQGSNQCGPYAATAFLRSLGKTETSPIDMVNELPWKLPRGYTHPRALESLLEGQGIEIIAYDLGMPNEDEKLLLLQQMLSNGKPVILLTEMYGYQHYITLLGYNQDSFFVYDPVYTRGEEGMTVDDNGSLPGNRVLSSTELLEYWSKGGIAGFYTWYALTAAP